MPGAKVLMANWASEMILKVLLLRNLSLISIRYQLKVFLAGATIH